MTLLGSRQWTTVLRPFALKSKLLFRVFALTTQTCCHIFCSHLHTAKLKLCHRSAYISLSWRLAAGTDGEVSNPAIITTFRKQTVLRSYISNFAYAQWVSALLTSKTQKLFQRQQNLKLLRVSTISHANIINLHCHHPWTGGERKLCSEGRKMWSATMCCVTHERAAAHDIPTTTMVFVFLGC